MTLYVVGRILPVSAVPMYTCPLCDTGPPCVFLNTQGEINDDALSNKHIFPSTLRIYSQFMADPPYFQG